MSVSYAETDARLAVRIRAHTQYSNLQLEDWLTDRLVLLPGGRVLDIACGDGNYFPVYSSLIGSSGLIIGLDVSDSLLTVAQARSHSLGVPALVFRWNFDNAFPFLDGEFDGVLCMFAAYYAKDSGAWVDEVLRVTRPGGQIIVVGPADDNAKELYELNERVTGVAGIEETDYTTGRLGREFLPHFRKRIGDRAQIEHIDRKIVFPNPGEYASYYLATWLYEKTAEKSGRTFTQNEVEQCVTTNLLSKRLIAVTARL